MRRLPLLSLLTLGLSLGLAGCEKEASNPPVADEAQDADEDVDDEADEADEAEEDESEEEEASPLTTTSFEEAMQDHYQDVVDCYIAALETKPDLKGELKLHVTIDQTGHASEIAVAEGSTLSDEGLVACVSEKAKGWAFDKPSKETATYDFPFNLEPG